MSTPIDDARSSGPPAGSTSNQHEMDDAKLSVVSELAKIVLGQQTLNEVLERVTKIAQRALPSARDVSVTLLEDRHPAEPYLNGRLLHLDDHLDSQLDSQLDSPLEDQNRPPAEVPRPLPGSTVNVRSIAFSSDLAVDLDERQYASGRGPCLDAAVTGATILADTENDQHYPQFCAAARHRNVPWTLSVGLALPGRTIGALNIYASPGQHFSRQQVDLAEHLALFAAIAVANATTYDDTAALARDMQAAMASRASIEQGKGILMERHQCDAHTAFEILRRASSRSNTKLRDIAAALVADVAASEATG